MTHKSKSPFRRFMDELAFRLRGLFREEVLVLGDSHSAVFRHPLFRASFPRHIFRIVSVGGATASGLKNPNSNTQASAVYADAMQRSKARRAIVLLGEVDTGFVIWYRAEKYRVPVEDMFEVAVAQYLQFIEQVSARYRVICISTPLPTIVDGQDWGEVANARREVSTTQRERTALTLQFNARICDACRQRGVEYLSFDESSLGANGLVLDRLRHPDPADHHYLADAHAAMMIPSLQLTLRTRPELI